MNVSGFSGPSHGVCDCGQCYCTPSYTGENCGCSTRNDSCIASDGVSIELYEKYMHHIIQLQINLENKDKFYTVRIYFLDDNNNMNINNLNSRGIRIDEWCPIFSAQEL